MNTRNQGFGMVRKWLFGAMLAVASSVALTGNWVFVGNAETQDYYVDTTSVLRDGNTARIWADLSLASRNTLIREYRTRFASGSP